MQDPTAQLQASNLNSSPAADPSSPSGKQLPQLTFNSTRASDPQLRSEPAATPSQANATANVPADEAATAAADGAGKAAARDMVVATELCSEVQQEHADASCLEAQPPEQVTFNLLMTTSHHSGIVLNSKAVSDLEPKCVFEYRQNHVCHVVCMRVYSYCIPCHVFHDGASISWPWEPVLVTDCMHACTALFVHNVMGCSSWLMKACFDGSSAMTLHETLKWS